MLPAKIFVPTKNAIDFLFQPKSFAILGLSPERIDQLNQHKRWDIDSRLDMAHDHKLLFPPDLNSQKLNISESQTESYWFYHYPKFNLVDKKQREEIIAKTLNGFDIGVASKLLLEQLKVSDSSQTYVLYFDRFGHAFLAQIPQEYTIENIIQILIDVAYSGDFWEEWVDATNYTPPKITYHHLDSPWMNTAVSDRNDDDSLVKRSFRGLNAWLRDEEDFSDKEKSTNEIAAEESAKIAEEATNAPQLADKAPDLAESPSPEDAIESVTESEVPIEQSVQATADEPLEKYHQAPAVGANPLNFYHLASEEQYYQNRAVSREKFQIFRDAILSKSDDPEVIFMLKTIEITESQVGFFKILNLLFQSVVAQNPNMAKLLNPVLSEFAILENQGISELVVYRFANKLNFKDYQIEIDLKPLDMAVYRLFLEIEGGFKFKDRSDYKKKVLDYYLTSSNRQNEGDLIQRIEKMFTLSEDRAPLDQSISRINAAFKKQFAPEIAYHYMITGARGGNYGIVLNRNLLSFK